MSQVVDPALLAASATRWRAARLRTIFSRPSVLIATILLVAIGLVALLQPLVAPRSYADQDLSNAYARPGEGHGLLGTDGLGRDQWTRLLFGLRLSLAVALFSQFVQVMIGVPIGIVAGYFGGRTDRVLMRLVDTLLTFPVLLFALVITLNIKVNASEGTGWWAATIRWLDDLTAGLTPVLVVIVLVFWAATARLVRGTVLTIREQDYVRAARSMGASRRRIMFRHVLPHVWSPVLVATTIAIPLAIVIEAGLSFFGLGVDPPTPSLGLMIQEGARQINSFPILVLIPSAALVLLTLLFTYLGDGLRTALDPRARVR